MARTMFDDDFNQPGFTMTPAAQEAGFWNYLTGQAPAEVTFWDFFSDPNAPENVPEWLQPDPINSSENLEALPILATVPRVNDIVDQALARRQQSLAEQNAQALSNLQQQMLLQSGNATLAPGLDSAVAMPLVVAQANDNEPPPARQYLGMEKQTAIMVGVASVIGIILIMK